MKFESSSETSYDKWAEKNLLSNSSDESSYFRSTKLERIIDDDVSMVGNVTYNSEFDN